MQRSRVIDEKTHRLQSLKKGDVHQASGRVGEQKRGKDGKTHQGKKKVPKGNL